MNTVHALLITLFIMFSSHVQGMSTLKKVVMGALLVQSSLMGTPALPLETPATATPPLNQQPPCYALTVYFPLTQTHEMVFNGKLLIKGELPYPSLQENERYITSVVHTSVEQRSNKTYPLDERSLLTPINCSSTIPSVSVSGNVETTTRYYFKSSKLSQLSLDHLHFITKRALALA